MCDVLEFVVHLGEQMTIGSLSSQPDKLLSSGGARGRWGGGNAESRDGAVLAFHYGREVDNAVNYLMLRRLGI